MNLNSDLSLILSAEGVRKSCHVVWEYLCQGRGHFKVNIDMLPNVAEIVANVIRDKYPELNIPYHSRWGHFNVGHRKRSFESEWKAIDGLEYARREFDLVIPSVLLDAGSGPKWKFVEDAQSYNRSEGLAVASFYMFKNGEFSSDKNQPHKSDGQGLLNLRMNQIEKGFQVTQENPLLGVEGRLNLLKSLGSQIKKRPDIFIGDRVGGLVDYIDKKFGREFEARHLLSVVAESLGAIWPGRLEKDGVNLGDAWIHQGLDRSGQGLVVFHKLSQWLSYSLIEPLERAGFSVTHLNSLTGLAEYRNGGLFVDSGLLELKDKSLLNLEHSPKSDLIIEWRAATVMLLDELLPIVRRTFGKSEAEFPLVKLLEGGSWWAGRRLAAEKRSDSSPPIKIVSDGTVF